MRNNEDTSRIEKEQAEHAGDVAPAGAVTVDRALIREMNLTLRELGRKICNTCGVEQDLHADYQPDKRLPDGRAGRCRTCANQQRQTNRAAADGLAYALERGKGRAEKAGLPANKFTRAELLVYWDDMGINPWECFYTGVPLVREPHRPNSRTIDHVEPLSVEGSAGHVIGNIVPCAAPFNTSKGDRPAHHMPMLKDPDKYPGVCYVGLNDGLAGVDGDGNPLAPAQVEWSDGDSPAVEFAVTEQGAE